MKTMIEKFRKNTSKKLAPAIALALALSFGSYELYKPSWASAATPAPAAAPMDENSVSAITALDRATEALAAHVTPAVVNVTVASKVKQAAAPADMQDSFGQLFAGPAPGSQGPHLPPRFQPALATA